MQRQQKLCSSRAATTGSAVADSSRRCIEASDDHKRLVKRQQVQQMMKQEATEAAIGAVGVLVAFNSAWQGWTETNRVEQRTGKHQNRTEQCRTMLNRAAKVQAAFNSAWQAQTEKNRAPEQCWTEQNLAAETKYRGGQRYLEVSELLVAAADHCGGDGVNDCRNSRRAVQRYEGVEQRRREQQRDLKMLAVAGQEEEISIGIWRDIVLLAVVGDVDRGIWRCRRSRQARVLDQNFLF